MSNDQTLLHPEFHRQAARVSQIAWGASAGKPLPPSLAGWCESVGTASAARNLLESDAWEAWSSGLQGSLTEYLDRVHHRRYQDWRRISASAKELLAVHEPEIAAGLAAAELSGTTPLDAVRWDVVVALVCAGFADCDPPDDTLTLLDIYEAGHLPVGWNPTLKRVLVY